MLLNLYITPPDVQLFQVLAFFVTKENGFSFVFSKMNDLFVFYKPITESIEISIQDALYLLNAAVSND